MTDIKSGWKVISKDWGETLLFSALVTLSSIIPFYSMGIYVEMLGDSIKGKLKMPKIFDNVGERLLNGLKILVFEIILLLPYIILAILANSSENTTTRAAILAIALIIELVLVIASVPLVCNFAQKKNFSSLFEFNAIKKITKNPKEFAMTILYVFAYEIVAGIIWMIPVLGNIAGILFSIGISYLVGATYLGAWYREA